MERRDLAEAVRAGDENVAGAQVSRVDGGVVGVFDLHSQRLGVRVDGGRFDRGGRGRGVRHLRRFVIGHNGANLFITLAGNCQLRHERQHVVAGEMRNGQLTIQKRAMLTSVGEMVARLEAVERVRRIRLLIERNG
ncbi:MAG TPA: hypothetical protein VGI81_01715 [Tepidisphaeraceae bacterium]